MFFEEAYLFLWYIGPMHHVEWFDYTGVSAPRTAATWAAYAALTVGLFAVAWIGRMRQVRN